MSYGPPPSGQLAPSGFSNAESQKFCAYNQTRKRFLSANVEVADFSPTILQDRLPMLTESADFALWHVPFKGISPALVSDPIDLMYLDADCLVIETVESFPIAQVSSSSQPASSVLVLKAGTIESSGTQSGDQFVLCGAEEMKRRLKRAAKGLSHDSVEQLAELSKLFSTVDLSKGVPAFSKPFIVDPNTVSHADAQFPNLETNPISFQKAKSSKNWLQRLFSPDPVDPRTSEREALEWLVAYFFTGTTPVPHKVRDVGLSGIYIYTEERWSPDSIIRLTLTDARDPSAERSITVNARVIRWGNDGVGFRFVLKSPEAAKRYRDSVDNLVEGVTRKEVAQFLERVRGNPF